MIEKTLTIPESILKAENMSYDNSNSGLKATDTQSAIDEIHDTTLTALYFDETEEIFGDISTVSTPDNLVYWEEDETVSDEDFDTAIDNAIMSLEFDVTDDGLLGLYYKGNLITSVSVGGSSIDVVKCTSIVLDKNELSLSDRDATSLLTATVEPFDCTQTVKWYSSNTDVATVSDGEITVIGKGTTTITAKCGNYSTTCVITILNTDVTGWIIVAGASWYAVAGAYTLNDAARPDRAYLSYNGTALPAEPNATYEINMNNADNNWFFGVDEVNDNLTPLNTGLNGWRNVRKFTFTTSANTTRLILNFKYGSDGTTTITNEMANLLANEMIIRKVGN